MFWSVLNKKLILQCRKKPTMKNIKLILASLFLISILCSCRPTSTATPEQQACFEQVQVALDSASQYRYIFELKLQDYKNKTSSAPSVDAAYYYNKLITGCYYSFDSDSAAFYINRNMLLAEQENHPEWMVDCLLQLSYLHNFTGMLEETAGVLARVKEMPKTFIQQQNYYLECISYWSNRAISLDLPNPDPMAHAYADSLLAMGDALPEPMKLHARFWSETAPEKKHELLQEMTKMLPALSPDDEWYTRLYGEAGILAQVEGNMTLALQLFTRQIVAQFSNVDRTIPMLATVSGMALDCGELDYAKNFMMAVVAMQKDYPDRIRTVSKPLYSRIIQLNDAIQLREKAVSDRIVWLSVILAVSLLAAIALLLTVYQLLKKKTALQDALQQKIQQLDENTANLEQEHRKLSEANAQLSQQDVLLREEREHLEEANYLKEEYIGQMFATNSEYLQKIAALKKDINRKLMAKQYEQAVQMTSSKSEKNVEEQHELWNKFDEIFLQLFPDFIEQFNGLLRPEEQITLKAGEKLNTDLRIYALVRLGINNSVKIGKILGLSTQTVYNARQKMRARATENEVEFPVRVKNLKNK